MDFYPISNDRNNSDDFSRNFKRRKFQIASSLPNSCSAETYTVSDDEELAHLPWNTNSDQRQLQMMTAQLHSDLPLFIDRAKQLFSDNNIDDRDIPQGDNYGALAASFQARRKEFVGQAIRAYLQHFAPASTSQKFLEIASRIFSTSFSFDTSITEVDKQIPTVCRHHSLPMMPSAASYMAKPVEQVTFEKGFETLKK
jgi:hypothetical protein